MNACSPWSTSWSRWRAGSRAAQRKLRPLRPRAARARRSDVKVFLTGASSGIGEALARHYAAGGATLGLVARRGELLAALQGALPCPCEIYGGDVRDADSMRAAAARFIERHGVPDLVI